MSSSLGLVFVLLGMAVVRGTTPHGLADQVLDLPGWDAPLSSRWFSGHVCAGEKEGKMLFHHYMLLESERDPANDPVLVWSNGGPGAPSLFGLMVELGPILLRKGGRMERNPYNWNKEANLIILNGPPPVGFSYCTPPGPAGDFNSCGTWNDSATAFHNRVAIENVVKTRHPRLLNNNWVFSGESYAGVYIPTLVRELLANEKINGLKISAMAVGNACMGTDVLCFSDGDFWWRAVFLRGHAQVSDKSFAEFDADCGPAMRRGEASAGCKAHLARLESEAGAFYEYDIYSECWYDADFGPPSSAKLLRQYGIGGDEFCGGDAALTAWTADLKVRRALNVASDSTFLSGDNGVGFTYTYGEKDLRPFYKQLAARKNFRVLVYNGDTDVSVNVFASQNWTSHLGLKEQNKWRPWTLDGNKAVVGYVTEYQGDFSFATIRGSGHMVPQFKAAAAFEMLQRFLRAEPLKPYVKKSPSDVTALDSNVVTIS
jgi:serine carboxypeptidase-like clade 1